ncbi:MAG: hypothetical protein RL062_393, partial [Bacteroidota bacterium]
MIEFENKYRLYLKQANRLGFVFFQHVLFIFSLSAALTSLGQPSFTYHCYASDSIPFVFKAKIDAEKFMTNQLKLELSEGHAIAKWELFNWDSLSSTACYKLIPGKIFQYGEITNWNGEWMTLATAQQLLYWNPRRTFTGIPFDARDLKNLENFGMSLSNSQIFFNDSIAHLRLDAKPISKNRFQGILGSQSNSGKTTILGEIEAQWVNHFKRAEKLYFHWQRQAAAVQKMESVVHFPVILKSAFGVHFGFDFYRNTQSFFQVSTSASLDYRWKKSNTISMWSQVKNHTQLTGENVAIQHQLLGLRLDQKIIQTDTWQLHSALSYAQGNQKTSADFNREKNKIQKSEFQLTLNKKNKSTYFNLNIHHSGIWAQKITTMEKIRLGGMSSIRGFAQESIFCNHYTAQQFQFGKNWSDQWNV